MTSSTPAAPDAPDVPKVPSARLTSRKFLLALATLAAASLLLWWGRIEALVWRDVVIATGGAYITANVTQRVMAAKAGGA